MKIGDRDYRQAKGHASSGTHRSRHPRDTFEEYRRNLPAFGITRLANITGLDRIGIPVYVAIRPNSRSLATAQGKGADNDHARVSAMMESIENWHAEHITLPVRIESHSRLCRETEVIDVSNLSLRSKVEFRAELPIPWLEGDDLLSGQKVRVPFECVTMNTVLTFAMRLSFAGNSNGLASGNHFLEAVNHALFEVIERDSHAEWLNLNDDERLRTKVDPNSVNDTSCREMLEKFDRARMNVAIWDMTTPVYRIPSYVVQIVARDEDSTWRRLSVSFGSGCHLSPVVALARALSEAAQSRLTIISGSRDDNLPQIYENQTNISRFEHWKIRYFDPPAVLPFSGGVDGSTTTFEGDTEVVLSALRRRGVRQALVVDLTQPAINIPVVKVIVPGLAIGDESAFSTPLPQSSVGQR